jgi:hypothetical protein
MQRRKRGHVFLFTSHIFVSLMKYNSIPAFKAFTSALFITFVDLYDFETAGTI